ncbi:NAD(P)-binding protein [Lipomyces oligophaga]|uniref:NAD(P)-binding protein n=1 Tax=Lipomyces oligophaga TaxID=45792 RepID=UPI0034CDE812
MGVFGTQARDLFSLEGKVAVVTGGTRGIGAGICIGFAEAGADVVLIQRSATNTSTKDAIEKMGNKAWIVQCDLSNAEEVRKVTKYITEDLGLLIDILVNCGGIQRRHPAELFPESDWDEVIQVNLKSCWCLARDIGRHILETKSQRNGSRGKIINIASLASFQGGITVPAYAAAKHGIVGLTKALSNEWVGKGINVNAVAPGYIATEMNTALIENPTRSRQIMERIPANRWGSSEDFKGVVIFLASAASDYVSGDVVTVDGGWMAR